MSIRHTVGRRQGRRARRVRIAGGETLEACESVRGFFQIPEAYRDAEVEGSDFRRWRKAKHGAKKRSERNVEHERRIAAPYT